MIFNHVKTHEFMQNLLLLQEESDESLKDFVVSGSDSETSSDADSVVTVSSTDEKKSKKTGRLTRSQKNGIVVLSHSCIIYHNHYIAYSIFIL